VVIVGQEDWDAGNVTVRSLTTRDQQQVPLDSTAATVTALLA
jgi:histidyl-tRNA synthetase